MGKTPPPPPAPAKIEGPAPGGGDLLIRLPPDLDLDAGDLPVGTKLARSYKGRVYEVFVRPPLAYGGRNPDSARRRRWWRYEYRGKRYKTLSAIAALITGDRYMSGNRFFGLRLRRRGCQIQRRSTDGMD